MSEYSYKSNIWKISTAMFIARLELVSAVFVLFLLGRNLSMLEIMILQSFFTFIIFGSEVPSGVIADLYGRKNAIMLSFVIGAIGFLLYPLCDSFWQFFLPEAFIGLSIAMKSGADSALIYDSLKEVKKEKKFGKIFGRYMSLQMFGLGIGALFGGFIAEIVPDLGYLFFFTTLLFLIGLIIFAFTKETKHHKKIIEKNYFRHLKEGLRISKTNVVIRSSIIYISVLGAFTWLLYMLMQPYFQEGGLSYGYIGIGVSTFFFFNALGYHFSELYSKQFKNNGNGLLFISFSIAILFATLGIINVWGGFVIIAILMFLSAIKEIIIENLVNLEADSRHRATIISIKNMAMNLSYALFAPFIGYIAGIYTARGALVISGIILFIFGIFNLFLFKNKAKAL